MLNLVFFSNLVNFFVNLVIFAEKQRWDRIRITGVDSGRILRFSFGPGSGVKNLGKNGPGSGVTFQFPQ